MIFGRFTIDLVSRLLKQNTWNLLVNLHLLPNITKPGRNCACPSMSEQPRPPSSKFTVHPIVCFLFSGLLVPGGFGSRGIEGKIAAVNWARIHQRPFLGVCLGLQVATIEFARNVLGMQGLFASGASPIFYICCGSLTCPIYVVLFNYLRKI